MKDKSTHHTRSNCTCFCHATAWAVIYSLLLLLLSGADNRIYSQSVATKDEIQQLVQELKQDLRGPYKDIRWFCKDGTIIPPKEKCPEPGGVQRARYKDQVAALAKSNHLFLGQILSTTSSEEFWDVSYNHSRIKQYQLEKYLRAADNGWIMRKGQYYRGALQVEDESVWGNDFLKWLLAKDAVLESQYFFLRQMAKDIPHRAEDNLTMQVRAISKNISDLYPSFQDLRVKIHGQPEEKDLANVRLFLKQHKAKLTTDLEKEFDELIRNMEALYQPIDLAKLSEFTKVLPKDAPLTQSIKLYTEQFNNTGEAAAIAMATAEKLLEIRQNIKTVKGKQGQLALLDLSNALEDIFFRTAIDWKPETIQETAEKICYTAMAAVGTGFIEFWEWDQISPTLTAYDGEIMSLSELNKYLHTSRSLIEWGTGMINGVYAEVVQLYSGFEPMANGFTDDKIRSSLLLPLGETVSILGDFLAQEAGFTNRALELSNQSTLRGLNPGIALGELVVADGDEHDEVSNDKIYVFQNAPSDLKPVAGIMTVSEGNMVSHVQLLARNLGIPNTVISSENMSDLRKYNGQKVFYAVSNEGTVVMKMADQMSPEEIQLFSKQARKEERIRVPTEKIDLNQNSILNLSSVNAESSGKTCGPKAANLGQLKATFPGQVVEGVIIPFGIFREHLDQIMPGMNISYWEFINSTFTEADKQRLEKSTEAVDSFILGQLQVLRDAMKKMTLSPSFVALLERSFVEVFGSKIGTVPVFLRSDTNMEDLKDFTGAGLNLTIFNVREKEKIIEGIKSVWASPYTERSFKWRQRYLLNPENVFPSILIIPSVDVDYSGVLITKGITTGDSRDATIAFSRGAGGAVDGQAAESYLLSHQGDNILLSPAREAVYRRLPEAGGSKKVYTTFDKPILNSQNLSALRQFTELAREKIPKTMEIKPNDPLDIELGFKDNKLWLFQVRPFVENKNAANLSYLDNITPKFDDSRKILLDTKINRN